MHDTLEGEALQNYTIKIGRLGIVDRVAHEQPMMVVAGPAACPQQLMQLMCVKKVCLV